MSTNLAKNFVMGLVSGILLTVVVGSLVKGTSSKTADREILAELDGDALTRTELEKKLGASLIPLENDEYQIVSRGIDEWIETRLAEKEAKSKNVSTKDLYVKEVWSQVRVSSGDVLQHYQKNAGLYSGQAFEKLLPLLTQQLRSIEYEKIKREYIQKLREKYHVKVHLEKPESYVKGLAAPLGEGNLPDDLLALFPTLKVADQPAAKPAEPPFPSEPAAPTVTFTDLQGRPSMGPENAPVTIVEFSDFHCPFCKRGGETVDQLIKNYPGKIRRVWRHFPLPFHTGADRTHAASECAHEQGKFWQYHGKIFEAQGAGAFDDPKLQQIADQVGLDKQKFQACLTSNKHLATVQADIKKGSEVGVNGTPAFFINGKLISGAQPYQNFSNAVDVALDPSKAANLPAAAPPQAPPPPPTNVVFNDLEGRPSVGPKDAAITLVEFSDFHCPFCKRVEPTIDQLMKNYQGKIRKVWRHFPLPFHPGADRTHEASECAHEQGKFWEYHAKLIETLGATRDDAALNKMAEEVKLDKKKFEQCLTSGKYKALIQKEIAQGQAVGVNGTPAVFVNGQLVSGAQPYESFDSVVKSKLSQ